MTRRRLSSADAFDIREGGKTLYKANADTSSDPTIVVKRAGGAFFSAAKFDRHDNNFSVSVDELKLSQAEVVYAEGDAGPFNGLYKFIVAGRTYAWQKCLHRVFVRLSNGETDKTMGRDWKLIMLEKDETGGDARALAVHIALPHSWKTANGSANIHWLQNVSADVEAASLAAIMGIRDRIKKSGKEYTSGTSLLYT